MVFVPGVFFNASDFLRHGRSVEQRYVTEINFVKLTHVLAREIFITTFFFSALASRPTIKYRSTFYKYL